MKNRTPTLKQDSDVEIENLHTFINRYAGEGHYRCKYYHVRGEVVKEPVRMPYRNDFLGKHLEDVAEYLQRAPFPDPVRAEAALEGRADLALHVNHYDGYDYVQYSNRSPIPIARHSMIMASVSGITEVSCPCIQFVTTPKSNIFSAVLCFSF